MVSSYIYFSNTQASNDGILYEETFNNETEAEFNSTHEDIPVAFTDFMFAKLSQTLAAKSSPSTNDFQFDYVVAESRLKFRIFNPTVSLPPPVLQPINSATKVLRR